VVAQKMLIYHTSGGTREAKQGYRTRLSFCLQVFRYSYFLPFSAEGLLSMQTQAGTVVLSLNMNKKKLNPPFNLL